MANRPTKKSRLGLGNKLMLWLNLVVVFFLAISYLASMIDPGIFWPLAFFGLAYPAILLGNIFFIIYWCFKRPSMALISMLTIFAGWKFLVSHVGLREPTAIEVPKSSSDFIRIMTYNIHYFKKMDNINSKLVRDQMFDLIRKEQPDVICLQEFMTHNNGDINTEKTMKELMSSMHFYFNPVNGSDAYERIGLAIYSKYPIKKKGSILFPGTERGNEAIYTDLEINKKIVRLYNVHFQSIAFQPDDYKAIEDVKDISPDVESSRRIGSRLKQAFIKRADQVTFLKQETEKCETPFIIAGDFNDTPISYAVNTMSKGLKNAFIEKGSGFGNTYNGDFPNFQIDYILTSLDFDIKNYLIINKKLSDHFAVRSDVELLK
jgi:endonuclease/exonuclease/phosphatase family metal-dependent hydrolase